MKNVKITLIAVAIIALTVPAALAGGDDKSEYKKDMTTIEGEVQSVYTKRMEGTEAVLMDLQTKDHPHYTVCIGQKDMDHQKLMKLEDGDKVSVTGSKMVRGNGETVFIAHELRHGDQHWKLDHHKDMHRMKK